MKRRLLILLLVAALAVLLVACDEDVNGTAAADDEAGTPVQNGEQVDNNDDEDDEYVNDDEADVEDENDNDEDDEYADNNIEQSPLLQDIDNYFIEINGNRYYPLMTLYDVVAYGDFYLASVGSRRGEDGEVYVDDLFDPLHQPRIMSRYGLTDYDVFSFPIVTNYMDVIEGTDTNGSLLLLGLRYRFSPTDADTVVLPFGLDIGMDLDSIIDILGEPYNINELGADNTAITYNTELVGSSGVMVLTLTINYSGLVNVDFILQAP